VGVIERAEKPNLILTTMDNLLKWGRSRSLWICNAGSACCSLEMMATGCARYDMDRFGVMVRGSPRQSDVLIIPGPVTKKMAPIFQRVYNQMPEPRWVIAMGSCAISGGAFADSYSMVRGADKVLPVDVYIPGCPPRPEALLYGLAKLREKITSESNVGADRHPAGIYVPPDLPPEWDEEVERSIGSEVADDE
jgi:NADH-quinone oxidoreductase subunit B